MAQGSVRCGACLRIFTAREHFVPSSDSAPVDAESNLANGKSVPPDSNHILRFLQRRSADGDIKHPQDALFYAEDGFQLEAQRSGEVSDLASQSPGPEVDVMSEEEEMSTQIPFGLGDRSSEEPYPPDPQTEYVEDEPTEARLYPYTPNGEHAGDSDYKKLSGLDYDPVRGPSADMRPSADVTQGADAREGELASPEGEPVDEEIGEVNGRDHGIDDVGGALQDITMEAGTRSEEYEAEAYIVGGGTELISEEVDNEEAWADMEKAGKADRDADLIPADADSGSEGIEIPREAADAFAKEADLFLEEAGKADRDTDLIPADADSGSEGLEILKEAADVYAKEADLFLEEAGKADRDTDLISVDADLGSEDFEILKEAAAVYAEDADLEAGKADRDADLISTDADFGLEDIEILKEAADAYAEDVEPVTEVGDLVAEYAEAVSKDADLIAKEANLFLEEAGKADRDADRISVDADFGSKDIEILKEAAAVDAEDADLEAGKADRDADRIPADADFGSKDIEILKEAADAYAEDAEPVTEDRDAVSEDADLEAGTVDRDADFILEDADFALEDIEILREAADAYAQDAEPVTEDAEGVTKDAEVIEEQTELSGQEEGSISEAVALPTDEFSESDVPDSLDDISTLHRESDIEFEPALEIESIDIEPAQRGRGVARWVGYFAVHLLLIVTLGLQFAWYRVDTLWYPKSWLTLTSQNPGLRKWYMKACDIVGCTLPDYVNLAEITAERLVIRSHPTVDNALMVDAIILNSGLYPQPFPILELNFSNLENVVLATRRFKPSEYLGGELVGSRYIPSQTEVHLSLEIVDPGKDAVNWFILRF